MVQKIQSNITIPIITENIDNTKILHAIRVLDIMNNANEKRDHKHRIDFKEFYNDAINKEVRLTTHY